MSAAERPIAFHRDSAMPPPLEPFGLLAPASAGNALAAQRLEDDREAKANLLAKANEYDYLAACNKGKEFEIPSATMLIGGAAVRRH